MASPSERSFASRSEASFAYFFNIGGLPPPSPPNIGAFGPKGCWARRAQGALRAPRALRALLRFLFFMPGPTGPGVGAFGSKGRALRARVLEPSAPRQRSHGPFGPVAALRFRFYFGEAKMGGPKAKLWGGFAPQSFALARLASQGESSSKTKPAEPACLRRRHVWAYAWAKPRRRPKLSSIEWLRHSSVGPTAQRLLRNRSIASQSSGRLLRSRSLGCFATSCPLLRSEGCGEAAHLLRRSGVGVVKRSSDLLRSGRVMGEGCDTLFEIIAC